MHVSIAGKQLDIGNSLQEYTTDHLEKTVKKYFEHAVTSNVVFSKEAHLCRADIIVNEGTGHHLIIKGTGESHDAYAAFDAALARISTQLRRYKRRIKDHNKPKLSEVGIDDAKTIKGMKYIMAPLTEENGEAKEMPVIIAEKTTSIDTLSVADAVMQMDLQHLPALLFINNQNGRINVVYHREDGNIAWVDSAA